MINSSMANTVLVIGFMYFVKILLINNFAFFATQTGYLNNNSNKVKKGVYSNCKQHLN